jgi:catechol 2,3-dioxygenase-like lactoylglutathione lyase family enzyme
MATIRYLVNDVDEALNFYVQRLGFEERERWGSVFAMVSRGDLILWLSGPQTSAARPMPDGRQPEAGGWNRLVLEVDDIVSVVEELLAAGATFRNEIISGPGGQQVLLEDPSGNPIELFQAAD